ncbi:hypothetical protein KQX54_007902 [Cotesia glomerata]|uniref:Uncharacterized protein n=1 Tax=Cotesia glomerata TaxID=32391 RepID=A0AAV7J6I7_COTGL|nr:hypothetical protein KQX54_007902 [Cotesia glomerata]
MLSDRFVCGRNGAHEMGGNDANNTFNKVSRPSHLNIVAYSLFSSEMKQMEVHHPEIWIRTDGKKVYNSPGLYLKQRIRQEVETEEDEDEEEIKVILFSAKALSPVLGTQWHEVKAEAEAEACGQSFIYWLSISCVVYKEDQKEP